jgi:hypothetical protein
VLGVLEPLYYLGGLRISKCTNRYYLSFVKYFLQTA